MNSDLDKINDSNQLNNQSRQVEQDQRGLEKSPQDDETGADEYG